MFTHVAVCRYGDTFAIFINGINVDEQTVSQAVLDFSTPIHIGVNKGISVFFDGFINEFRITLKSIYTENFDIPERPFFTSFIAQLQLFDVVLHAFRTSVTDARLVEVVPILDDRRSVITGTATGGTDLTMLDSDILPSRPSGTLTGSKLTFRSGPNEGAFRWIEVNDREGGSVTVNQSFDFPVKNGHSYTIELSYEPAIRQALRMTHSRIAQWLSREQRAGLLDGFDIDQLHLFLSLAIASESRRRNREDRFDMLATDYYGRHANEIQRIDLAIEEDGETDHVGIGVYWGP